MVIYFSDSMLINLISIAKRFLFYQKDTQIYFLIRFYCQLSSTEKTGLDSLLMISLTLVCCNLYFSLRVLFQVLLGSASKTTKSTLGRLGVFTVTSFHALVAARKPLTVPNIYGRGKHQGGMLSPRGDGTFRYHRKTVHNHSPDTQ